jgi:hypothetical protein
VSRFPEILIIVTVDVVGRPQGSYPESFVLLS